VDNASADTDEGSVSYPGAEYMVNVIGCQGGGWLSIDERRAGGRKDCV